MWSVWGFPGRATCNQLLMFDENTLCDYSLRATGAQALGERSQQMYDE